LWAQSLRAAAFGVSRLRDGPSTPFPATITLAHYTCPIGSYRDNISLPLERAKKLDETLNLLVQIGYLRMEEVLGIPRLAQAPGAVIFAPLATLLLIRTRCSWLLPFPRSCCSRRQLSAQTVPRRFPCREDRRAWRSPQRWRTAQWSAQGAVGNRVYSDLGKGELYGVIPGKDLERWRVRSRRL
jgi:hypothetical protein